MIVPGTIAVLLGFGLALCIAFRIIQDRKHDVVPEPEVARADTLRAFVILMASMFCTSLIGNSTLIVLPKWFADELQHTTFGTYAAIGTLIGLIYLFASLSHLVGGYFCGRFQVKWVYFICIIAELPFLLLAFGASGVTIVAVAAIMVFASSSQLPAEILLITRYTPARHRGTAFGARFILSFCSAPLAIQLVAAVHERFGNISSVFAILSCFSVTALLAAAMLPTARSHKEAAQGLTKEEDRLRAHTCTRAGPDGLLSAQSEKAAGS